VGAEAVSGDLARLEVVWKLIAVHRGDNIGIVIAGIYRLCRDPECVDIPISVNGGSCETAKCREFMTLNMGMKSPAAIAEARSGVEKPVFDLPVELEEVERLASEAGAIPCCQLISNIPFPEEHRKKLRRIAKGPLGVRNPAGNITVQLVDGGLVVDFDNDIFIMCLQPNCDIDKCLKNVDKKSNKIARALADSIDALRELAKENPEALIALLATAVVG